MFSLLTPFGGRLMADAYWMQLGGNPTFALEVNGRIVGITYWLDTGGLPAEGAPQDLPDDGWYFVSVTQPRHPERVAQGFELRRDMQPEELAQTVEAVLEAVANEVLADGGDE